jgi:hypothetical protein
VLRRVWHDRSELAKVVAAAQISPELVLVCPELAEQARAALPDQPWEAFLPRPASSPLGQAQIAAPRSAERSWPERLAASLPTLLLAVFTALIVVGSLPWLGDRPTLGPRQRVPPAPVVSTPTSPRTTPDASEQQQQLPR